ncbi:MAG: HipA N-terminal domain-containing protein [Saprospiraceae bacterium]
MRILEIYHNDVLAGTLTEESRQHYVFRYDDSYFNNANFSGISLTLPKTQQVYSSEYLFPFFFNMLSEGVNRKLQSTLLRIDEEDNFGLLAATAQYDTVGAITVKPIDSMPSIEAGNADQ